MNSWHPSALVKQFSLCSTSVLSVALAAGFIDVFKHWLLVDGELKWGLY